MEVSNQWLWQELRWRQGLYILRPKNYWTIPNAPWKIGVSKSTVGLSKRLSDYKTSLVRFEIAYVLVYKDWEGAERAERRLHSHLTDVVDVKRVRFLNTLQSEWFDCPLSTITKALEAKMLHHEDPPFIVYDWSDGKELKFITPSAPSQKVARSQRLFARDKELKRKEQELERQQKLLVAQAKARKTREQNKKRRIERLVEKVAEQPVKELSEREKRLLARRNAQKKEDAKRSRMARLLNRLS